MNRPKSPSLRAFTSFTALTTVLTVVCAAATAGCGDTCEEAALRLEECLGDGEEEQLYQGSEPECSGALACRSECTVEASCGDIGNYFCKLSRPQDPPAECSGLNPYEECVRACTGED